MFSDTFVQVLPPCDTHEAHVAQGVQPPDRAASPLIHMDFLRSMNEKKKKLVITFKLGWADTWAGGVDANKAKYLSEDVVRFG